MCPEIRSTAEAMYSAPVRLIWRCSNACSGSSPAAGGRRRRSSGAGALNDLITVRLLSVAAAGQGALRSGQAEGPNSRERRIGELRPLRRLMVEKVPKLPCLSLLPALTVGAHAGQVNG